MSSKAVPSPSAPSPPSSGLTKISVKSFAVLQSSNEPSYTTKEAYKRNCLDLHNLARRKNGVSDLVWDENLAKSALDWSKHLAKVDNGLEHSRAGENLYAGPADADCSRSIELWYEEKKFFPRNAVIDQNYEIYGHYTQIVWNTTKRVGCASYDGYLTCHYDPPGNYLGKNPFTYKSNK
jgi:uncharacterized protein YkwD